MQVEDEAAPFAAFDALLRAVPGIIVAVDEAGTVRWINDQVTDVSGFTPDELIGSNILDHLDLETNPLALESIGYALDTPGIRLPTVLGFRTKAGRSLAMEAVANNQFAHPALHGMVVHLRPCDERRSLERALGSLAAGEDVDVVLRHLVEVALGDTMQADTAVLLHGSGPDGGHRIVTVTGAASAARVVASTDGPSPWRAAAESGEPVVHADLAELHPDVGDAARSAGYAAVWAHPVRRLDGEGTSAVLVSWRRQPGPPEPSATMLAQQLVHLARLALDRHERTRQLFHAARHDHLTGLTNRAHFYDVLADHLGRDAEPVGVLYVDLDHFKAVNDRDGHGRGDQVLQVVARRLQEVAPDRATVARLGGDEFAICLPGAAPHDLTAVAERVIASVSRPIPLDGREHHVGATVGIARSRPGTGSSSDHLVGAADAALLTGKATDKGRWILAPDPPARPGPSP